MRVLVGMSGGVDSTVATYLLKEKGYEVIGVNFDFLNVNKKETDINDELISIKEKLGIEVYYKNFAIEFREKVIKYFVETYEKGLTPNPCAFCNGIMKFAKLYDTMKEYNCDMLATGHYANIEKVNDRYVIKKSKNEKKDQSYFLYRLDNEILKRTIFPIGDMEKEEVKDVARSLGLIVADKKESQDVCFINENTGNDYKDFILRYEFGDDYKIKIASGKLTESEIREKSYMSKGEFIDENGKVLGYHDGILNYTIGQRKGLNIAFGERKFVKSIDPMSKKIILCDNDSLYENTLSISDVKFSLIGSFDEIYDYKDEIFVKLRYRHNMTKAKIVSIDNGVLAIELDEKARAITKGQSAVFYDIEGRVLMGGIIR